MFEVNGMNIDVEGLQLIYDLKASLEQNGIALLGSIKPGIDNVQFSCPSHKNGQEHKPSCGLLLVDKGKSKAGTVHCFTCGYTASLAEFISFCFGKRDGGLFGNTWLKLNYKTELTQRNRTVELSISRTKDKQQVLPTIPDNVLDQYRYYHEYMWQRGLNEDIIDFADVGYDKDMNALTFPISNEKGEVKWILRRSVNNKHYIIPPAIQKTDYVYMSHIIREHPNYYDTVWIVESVLNCLTCWMYGIHAVALLGTGGGNQYQILRNLPQRHYVLALDNDEGGNAGKQRIIQELKTTKLLSEIIYPSNDGKDINDYQEKIIDFKKIPINF